MSGDGVTDAPEVSEAEKPKRVQKRDAASVITLRLDDTDRDEVKKAADGAGVSVSEWIRYAIRETLGRQPQRIKKGLDRGEGRTLGARRVASYPWQGPDRRLPPPVTRVRAGMVRRDEERAKPEV